MGCVTSSHNPAETEASKKIDAELDKEKKQLSSEVKLLLLGAGESGKSTIVKQMKIIHEKGYSKEECQKFKEVIFGNLIQSMQVLLIAMKNKNIEFADPELQSQAQLVLGIEEGQENIGLPKPVADAIKELWKDPGVLSCYDLRNEFQINDSASYYFNAIERLTDPVYIPTEDDILHSRVKTTGIVETQFDYKDTHFRMFDVGGQRSERKKWIHCFENVTAIIFCVAISAFDQVLLEDENTNRLEESLQLFDSICNSKWFVQTSIILFLNKADLFREKIKVKSLTCCFPEYTGANTFEAASLFIKNKYEMLNKSPNKQIYSHLTCATDTANVKFVFAAVTDIIIQNNLRQCGLL